MFDVTYVLFSLWHWLIQHGLPLSALLIIAILIPRIGRQLVRILTERLSKSEEETKAKLALVGALIYMLEIVAYFVVILLALTNLGVPAMGAAVPATVVSAAIGFGAQNIIGDFLSGFFIISERHYGVGDIVTFDDTSSQITGVVTKLTLRSTQIRTDPAAELVTIPNSMASVTINYSKSQSRAVVDLDIPLTGDESMAMLTKTVEDTANETVRSEPIADCIRSEVQVQPARSLTAPTAAGLPWTVLMRVGVDTAPANQWQVERAIRANLVNTFWDRFQSPAKMLASGTELDIIAPDAHTESSHDHATAPSPAPTADTGDNNDDSGDLIAAAAENSHLENLVDNADKEQAETEDDDTVLDDAATQVLPAPATDADADAEKPGPAGDDGSIADGPYESKTKNVLSFGGRFRPSTAGLFIALIVVGLLALFSSNPDDADPGILSPQRWQDRGASAETSEPEVPADTGDQTDDTDTEPTDGTGDQGTGGQTDTTGNPDADNSGTGDTGTTGGTEDGSGQTAPGPQNETDTGTDDSGDSTGEGDGTAGNQQNQSQGATGQGDNSRSVPGTDSGSGAATGESTAP